MAEERVIVWKVTYRDRNTIVDRYYDTQVEADRKAQALAYRSPPVHALVYPITIWPNPDQQQESA